MDTLEPATGASLGSNTFTISNTSIDSSTSTISTTTTTATTPTTSTTTATTFSTTTATASTAIATTATTTTPAITTATATTTTATATTATATYPTSAIFLNPCFEAKLNHLVASGAFNEDKRKDGKGLRHHIKSCLKSWELARRNQVDWEAPTTIATLNWLLKNKKGVYDSPFCSMNLY